MNKEMIPYSSPSLRHPPPPYIANPYTQTSSSCAALYALVAILLHRSLSLICFISSLLRLCHCLRLLSPSLPLTLFPCIFPVTVKFSSLPMPHLFFLFLFYCLSSKWRLFSYSHAHSHSYTQTHTHTLLKNLFCFVLFYFVKYSQSNI